MADELLASPEELEECAGRFTDAQAAVDERVNRMRGIVRALSDTWSGDAFNACAASFEKLCTQLSKAEELLRASAEDLKAVAVITREAEESASMMGGI